MPKVRRGGGGIPLDKGKDLRKGKIGGREVTEAEMHLEHITESLKTVMGGVGKKTAELNKLREYIRQSCTGEDKRTLKRELKMDISNLNMILEISDSILPEKDASDVKLETKEDKIKDLDLDKLRLSLLDAVKFLKENSEHIGKFEELIGESGADAKVLQNCDTLVEAAKFLLYLEKPEFQKEFKNFRKANLNHEIWYLVRPFFFRTERFGEAKDALQTAVQKADDIMKAAEDNLDKIKSMSGEESIHAANIMSTLVTDIADTYQKMADVPRATRGKPLSTKDVMDGLGQVKDKLDKATTEISEDDELAELKKVLEAQSEKLQKIIDDLDKFQSKSKDLAKTANIVFGIVMGSITAVFIAAAIIAGVLFGPIVIPIVVGVLGVVMFGGMMLQMIMFETGVSPIPPPDL